MNLRDYMRGSVAVAPMALLALSCSAVYADTLDTNPLIGTSGGGYIYVDTTEGVVEPGIKSVTFTGTRGPNYSKDSPEIIAPYEKVITDFSDPNLKSRGDVPNCLMANNDAFCDSIPGSGKRIKNYLTGMDAFDTRLRTSSAPYIKEDSSIADTSKVDYFTFGKMSNFSGARMTGFDMQLLDKDGNLMDELDPDNAVLFNDAAKKIGFGAGLTDGLFGGGGQEGDIGFFSDAKTKFDLNLITSSGNTLNFGELTNTEYNELFGKGYLDNSMVPDGIFWDDNDILDDEGALIAWNNPSKGGWTYGTLDIAENLDARLEALALALKVDIADLDYASGKLVPADILAAAQANGLFGVEPIEDLRNANLNYTMTIGKIDGNEFTVRISPKFAEIVESANSESQLRNAIYLDTVAGVPFRNLQSNNEAYQAAIDSLIAQGDDAKTSRALDSIGFGYAPAFSSLAFETSRDQVAAITRYVPWSSTRSNQNVDSNGKGSWLMQDGLYGFASQSGSRSEYDPIANALGYDIDVYSLSAGIEKRLTGTNSSLGLAVGYTDASAETYQDLGDVDADGYSVTAFTRTRFGDGGLVQALVGYQDLSYDSDRNTFENATANGKTDGTQKFAALSVDYLKDMGRFKVGPTASVEYYDISVDRFAETGAGIWNLEVAEQSSDILLASIGARGEYSLNNDNTRLTGSVKYMNASGDDLTIQTGFVGQAGSAPYTVKGMEEDLVDVSVGIDHVVLSNASTKVALYGGYNGSFGKDYENQGLHIGVNTTF
jgi:uncharacterized protein YhjY with autotransporter beta-barrel domain